MAPKREALADLDTGGTLSNTDQSGGWTAIHRTTTCHPASPAAQARRLGLAPNTRDDVLEDADLERLKPVDLRRFRKIGQALLDLCGWDLEIALGRLDADR